jgi:hypothetical protein
MIATSETNYFNVKHSIILFEIFVSIYYKYLREKKSGPTKNLCKNLSYSWAQCLTPEILASQVAEIRRIMVQSQPGQIVCKTLSQKNLHKKGMVE